MNYYLQSSICFASSFPAIAPAAVPVIEPTPKPIAAPTGPPHTNPNPVNKDAPEAPSQATPVTSILEL